MENRPGLFGKIPAKGFSPGNLINPIPIDKYCVMLWRTFFLSFQAVISFVFFQSARKYLELLVGISSRMRPIALTCFSFVRACAMLSGIIDITMLLPEHGTLSIPGWRIEGDPLHEASTPICPYACLINRHDCIWL